jgi:glutamine synthetase
MTFDGSSIDGFSRVQESDVLAMPDPNTFELLPWATEGAEARVFCDIANLDGTPFEGDPARCCAATSTAPRARLHVLRRPEIEFFYFAPADGPPRAARRAARTSTSPPTTSPARCASRRSARSRRWASRSSTRSTRTRPSQHEIDLRHTDALTMADSVMTFRLVVQEVARARASRHVHAQAARGRAGLGHAHPLSLFEGDDNAFYDPDDPYTCRRRQALHRRPAAPRRRDHRDHQPDRQLVQAARPGFEAPVHVSWARNNRSALVPVPIAKRASASRPASSTARPIPPATRTSPSRCMLAAGLQGIEEGYELPPEAEANLFELTDEELAKLGIEQLPQSLPDALGRWSVRARRRGRSASTSSSGSCATSARSGAATRPGDAVRVRPLPAGSL